MNEELRQAIERWKFSPATLARKRVVERLRALNKSELTLRDVLGAIKAEGLRPMKTLNSMAGVGGELKFVGEHRNDQRYTLKP